MLPLTDEVPFIAMLWTICCASFVHVNILLLCMYFVLQSVVDLKVGLKVYIFKYCNRLTLFHEDKKTEACETFAGALQKFFWVS